jgi:hypothetical protein
VCFPVVKRLVLFVALIIRRRFKLSSTSDRQVLTGFSSQTDRVSLVVRTGSVRISRNKTVGDQVVGIALMTGDEREALNVYAGWVHRTLGRQVATRSGRRFMKDSDVGFTATQ